MKLISLTKGKFAKVSKCDYEWLSKWKWYANEVKSGYWYAMRGVRFKKGHDKYGKIKILYMHKVIMKPRKKLYVDHINHDGLDNRRNNLRNVGN